MNSAEKHRFTIGVARRNIGIESVFDRMLLYSEDYLTDSPADLVVRSSEEDILQELVEYRKVRPGGRIIAGALECMLLLRMIADQMVEHDTLLMHGAVVAVDGAAFMFTAPSGTGKTTHIRRWLENLPEAYVVNGDKPLVIVGETPLACGTPWCGKERMGTNAIVPLKAIVMLRRAEANAMRPLSFIEAFPRLVEQAHRPKDTGKMRKTVRLLSELGKRVELWQLECNNFKSDAFEVAYRALIGRSDPDV